MALQPDHNHSVSSAASKKKSKKLSVGTFLKASFHLW
jgi:hypothetical protein